MELSRRELLRKLGTGTAATLAVGGIATGALAGVASAEEAVAPSPGALALLYDATKCIGCKACVAACARANGLQPDTRLDGLHQAPADLNAFTKNIIKLYKAKDGSYSFVKQQCMHCADPACVSACMFQGLSKDVATGIVSWNGSKCVGCRYCEIACPFHVPKFEWSGINPRIVKCELCRDRLEVGGKPACTAVCPTGAVIFGKRTALLAEARQRIQSHPGKYYQDRVYGEVEGGGTQSLYLSHVPFEDLGLPQLDSESIPHKYLKWQKRVYAYLAVPALLYVSLVGTIRGRWDKHREHLQQEEDKTGLRAQL
jgi:Fe-S-cluster-containing dehydrogenase component